MVKTLLTGTWALKHKLAILILLLVYLGVFSCRAQAQDTTPPVFQSATISGATLTATYNEDLKGDFTGTVFVVRINGRWVGVSRAGTTSGRNAIVTLNYWSRARPGDRVTLSYMVPASPLADPLIDDSGNSAGPFTNFPVTNITPDDPPKLWQANLKDNKIILLYDDELNANWRPPTSAYRVVHEGVEVTVTKVDVTRSDPTSSVILTLGRTFHQTDANARVSYTAPPEDNNNAVQDRSGNRAASFTDESAGNVTISTDDPKLVRVHTATDVRNPTRDIVYLRYDRILLPDGPGDMSNPFNPPASAYRVRVDGFPVAVTGTRITQSMVSLTLARRVTHRAQRVTVSYEIPTLNPVRARGALAPPLTDYPVEISIPPSGSGTGGANGRDVFYGIMVAGQVDAIAMEEAVGFGDTVVGTALTPHGFSFNGNFYAVEFLYVNEFDFLWLSLNGTLTEAEAARLVLHVDGKVFRFADTEDSSGDEWGWQGPNVSWDIGQIVPVLIVDAAAAGPALFVADVTVPEPEGSDSEADFVVTLNPAASETVTVDYATSDGTATAGDDYTETSGTLTFNAGVTSMTVSVPVLDDDHEDAGETIILTLSNPSGNAYLADATATGSISNHEAPIAQFPSLPDHHDGQAFTTELTFSEPMAMDADSLSTALTITGGSLTAATATTDGDSRSWQVSVQPQDRQTDVVFRLATANDCTSTSTLCSSDGQPLLKTLTATVAGAIEAPSVAGVAQVGATLEASFAHAPGGTLAWQWLRGSEPITGADGPAYTPTAADVGTRLSVRVEAGGAAATSAATAPVWPAPVNPPLAAGEDELLSAVLTLGSYKSGVRLGGYGRMQGQLFGAMDNTSFEDGGTTYAIEQFFVLAEGSFTLATDSRLPGTAGLAAYWNGYRITGLERTGPGGLLVGRTPQPESEYSRYMDGSSDGVRVAVSLRRTLPVVRVTGAAVISSPGDNGTWDAGETVEAEVRFSGPVTVTGPPDEKPTLAITLDGTRREAAYAGGSGTDTLSFRYTVAAGDDGAKRARIVADGLALNGAVLGAGEGGEVDTGFAAAPWVTAVALAEDASGDGAWTAGETIDVRLTFSEAVTVADGTPTVGVSVGGEAATLDYASGSGSATLVFSTSVPEGAGAVTTIAVVADSLVANAAAIVSQASGIAADLRHDGTEPIAAQQQGEAAPLTAEFLDLPAGGHGGNAFTFKLRFSEEIPLSYKTLQNHALGVTNGTLTGVARATQGENRAWNVTVTPTGGGAVTVALPETTDCAVEGAICAAGQRKLAAVSATVPGTAPVPFLVRLKNVPDGHDGTSEIVFEVAFTKEPAGYSYTTLRDHTLKILQGGERLTPKVRRLNAPKNDRWEVKVTPGSKEDLTVSIGPFTTCSDAGAVCAANDEVLSNKIDNTIEGPPGLSVADARVHESVANAAVEFAVTLSRASAETVTVAYATSDGPPPNGATAGDDYEPRSGTLTFLAGETSKTVSVPVFADDHDEGEETFVLTLSNLRGGNAWLKDATAVGTIENTGPMPRAWLARFGRTVAEQVIDAVEGRFSAQRRPGVELRLAGQAIGSGSGAGALDDEDARAAAEEARSRLAAMTNWLRGEPGGRNGSGSGAGSWDGERSGDEWRSVLPRELLTGTSFALTGEAGGAGSGTVSLWGRGAVSRFDGREGELTLSGEVTSAMLGSDWMGGPGSGSGAGAWTVGLLVSHSRGEGSYRGADAGTVSSTLTGLYPYGRYEIGPRLSVWGVAGYGAGSLTLAPDGRPAIETDMGLAMGAAGVRGVAVEAPGEGGVELSINSDALAVRTSSEASSGGAGGNLAGAEAEVTRLRLGLEGTWRGLEAGGGELVPRLEVGVRHDGGDAETGFGLDVGGGLSWSHPASGLSAELSGRGLLTHESRGFRDRGLSGSFGWEPGWGSGRGPKVTLTQTVGTSASGGMDALLRRKTLAGLADDDNGGSDPANRRLELRLGYGFPAFGDRFTSTPELGLGLGQGQREVSLGWRLNLARSGPVSMELGFEAIRREQLNDDAVEHGIGLRATARW